MRGARANRYAAGRAALRTGRFIGRAGGTISYQAAVACCPMFVAASAIVRPRALIGARATFAAATTSCIELRPNVAGARPTRRRTRRTSSISQEGRHAHSHSNRNGTAKGLPPRFAVARRSRRRILRENATQIRLEDMRAMPTINVSRHSERPQTVDHPLLAFDESRLGAAHQALSTVLRDFARWPVSRRFRSRGGAGT